jgi:hypothetical protein
MENNPKIIFWSKEINLEYPKLEQAEIKRDWMDKTYKKLAYLCTPLVAANSNGWQIKLPQDIVVKWNGVSEGIDGESQNNVEILSGAFYNNIKIATPETGAGSITFTFNLVPQTDPDHYLIVSGPPNYIFKDAQPLTGLLRTDHFMEHPLQITWKINVSDKEIIFPKGMPVCFITIHKKDLIEQTEVEIRQVDEKTEDRFKKYAKMRSDHFEKNGPYSYPKFYKNGINEYGEKKEESIKRIILKKVRYIEEEDKL